MDIGNEQDMLVSTLLSHKDVNEYGNVFMNNLCQAANCFGFKVRYNGYIDGHAIVLIAILSRLSKRYNNPQGWVDGRVEDSIKLYNDVCREFEHFWAIETLSNSFNCLMNEHPTLIQNVVRAYRDVVISGNAQTSIARKIQKKLQKYDCALRYI